MSDAERLIMSSEGYRRISDMVCLEVEIAARDLNLSFARAGLNSLGFAAGRWITLKPFDAHRGALASR